MIKVEGALTLSWECPNCQDLNLTDLTDLRLDNAHGWSVKDSCQSCSVEYELTPKEK